MKAAVQTTRRIPPQAKRRTRGHAAVIYRARKEASPASLRTPDFLDHRLTFPKPVLLRLVSSEASRLSKTNRLKVITRQEISAAVTLVQQRFHARAAG